MSKHAPLSNDRLICAARRNMLRAWDAAVVEFVSNRAAVMRGGPQIALDSGPAHYEWKLYAGTQFTTPGATGMGG